ncbi:monocarboxylate transporter 4 [Ailuropoda melanoleuca]|uniref:monocarboxylate transporter 4 n=1 Tax=Ailuropoda melanoleuca TaxID=9646 RepID=UPI00149422D2|nr:monocarboxylate transporter 4 [Ailuropoda melanoleuca]
MRALKVQKPNFKNSSELLAMFPKPRFDERPNTGDLCEALGGLKEINEEKAPSPALLGSLTPGWRRQRGAPSCGRKRRCSSPPSSRAGALLAEEPRAEPRAAVPHGVPAAPPARSLLSRAGTQATRRPCFTSDHFLPTLEGEAGADAPARVDVTASMRGTPGPAGGRRPLPPPPSGARQRFGFELHFGIHRYGQCQHQMKVQLDPPPQMEAGGGLWSLELLYPLASLVRLANLFLYFTKKLKKYLTPAPAKCRGSLLLCLLSCMLEKSGDGPISSILVNKYGSRPVMIVGGCLSGCGLIAASFSNTVQELYLYIGFIGGLGLAFNLNPALTMIGNYFYKRRPLANGLAMAGSPVFLSTLAPLNQALFGIFGWRGSFLILGGLLLNCCVAGGLMRPVGPPPTSAGKDRSKEALQEPGKPDLEKGAARPSMGLIANTKWIRPRIQYYFAASIVVNGVCHLLAPLSSTYIGFCVYAGFFGFAFGWFSSVLFETLMDLIGPQRFSSAVGLVTIVECCPVLLGPPLLGIVSLTTSWVLLT